MTSLGVTIVALALHASPRAREVVRRVSAFGLVFGLVYGLLCALGLERPAPFGAGLLAVLAERRLAAPRPWPWVRLALALLGARFLAGVAAEALHLPVLVVWLLAALGGAELGWLLAGGVAAVGLAHGLGLGPVAAWVGLAGCCAAMRALQGPDGLWLEPALRDGGRSTRSARATAALDVLFLAADAAQRTALRRALRRRGLAVEELLGGTLACRVEPRLLAGLTRPGAQLGFGSLAGVRAFDGGRPITFPSPEGPPPVGGLALDEVGRRLRTGRDGEQLPADCVARSVRVAVMDTGLSERGEVGRHVVARVDLTGGGRRDSHGDSVARVLLAVAGQAQLVDVRVLGPSGSGSLLWVLRGLDHCEREFRAGRLDLVNMSLGGPCPGDCPLCRALAAVTVPTTSAAGNAGRGVQECPGTSPHTLGVAALAPCGTRVPDFSGRGRCAAFGEDLRIGRRRVSGTSVAAPAVAGVLALAVEARRRAGVPALARDDAFAAVLACASRERVAPADWDACGAGLVNAAEAWRRCVEAPADFGAASTRGRRRAARSRAA